MSTVAIMVQDSSLPFDPRGFIARLEVKGREHFAQTLGEDWHRYMPLEQEAIIMEWCLQQTSGFGGYLKVVEGLILQRIADKHLYSHHPSRFIDPQEMVIQAGIEMPPSVASDLPFIINNIFPRAQAAGIDPHDLLPKMANLRLIVPKAREAIKNNNTDELIDLIHEAETSSWRDLRNKVNPEPQFTFEVVQTGPDEYRIQATVSAKQIAVFKSRFRNLEINWI